MVKYYVNNNADEKGLHEVHKENCEDRKEIISEKYVGNFPTCAKAVSAAKAIYSTADGCAYCSKACHTG